MNILESSNQVQFKDESEGEDSTEENYEVTQTN
jgi:hypothetical protein